ncbi:MAG: hypothetical protein IKQ55_10835 [Kiritimatiellae bacterium]|nr:hypothetical protein [Kiritimatiellia bacterium]
MASRIPWRAALAAALLFSAASCGRPSAPESAERDAAPPATEPSEVRKEFVILRELARQYAIQTEAGNAARLESVTRHLQGRLTSLPDEGRNEEERTILHQARQAASSP